MPWFLALHAQGQSPNQASNHELQASVNVDAIAQELVNAAGSGGVVAIPAVLRSPRHQDITLYVRPAAWGGWTFFELSDEDIRRLTETVNALAMAAQQRGRVAPQMGQVNPFAPQPGPSDLGSFGRQ